MCEADSTTQYDSDSTVCYSSGNESGPLFVEDTYSDCDSDSEEHCNEQEQQSNETWYCMCKEKVLSSIKNVVILNKDHFKNNYAFYKSQLKFNLQSQNNQKLTREETDKELNEKHHDVSPKSSE